MNHIIGKVVSCGAIILYCLNLPIEVWFLLENIFIVGMIPGIGIPDVWTISHVLDSFVKAMNKFRAPGKRLPTHRHPESVPVQSRVLPLLADLGAIRKVAGFMAHNAILFCSFCLVIIDNIDDLNYASWTYRDGATVKQQGRDWKAETTKTAKEELAKENGVRWTPMHNLFGWDPVEHTILGFMHNSLHGHAEHLLRMLWGIGRQGYVAKDLVEQRKEEQFSESDASEASEELPGLAEELETSPEWRRTLVPSTAADDDMDIDSGEGSTTPTPENPGDLDMGNEEDEDDQDEDYFPADFDFDGAGAFDFTPEQLGIIRTCIKDVQLPTWVGRPPINLGEAAHGKLKAQELLILFIVIFPLIIPELWWNQGDIPTRLLDNFYHLVACLNIIASYETSNAEANRYMDHFIRYRTSMCQLFTRFDTLPNHHFAMHNRDLLKHWGPLAVLSEFPGERLNGEFGKVKTNKRICERYPSDLLSCEANTPTQMTWT